MVYIAASPQVGTSPTTPGAFQTTFVSAVCQGPPRTTGPGPSFPCPHGYISKVAGDGSTLLAATYLGGSAGDFITAIAVDSAGNICVAGATTSKDFPITPDAYQSSPGPGFLSILSPDGRYLLHSTYVNFNQIAALAIDRQGRVLIAGDAPGVAGAQSYLTAFSAQLSSISYSVSLDSISPGGIGALALDASGNIFITGSANVRNAGSMNLLKLDSSGKKLWSFTFGSSQSDNALALSVNTAGEAYIAGQTRSPDFPVTTGAFRAPARDELGVFLHGFAVKVSADGSHLLYSALLPYIGGTMASTVDGADNLTIAAVFVSDFMNFPTTADSMQPCVAAKGGANVFFKLAPDGTHLVYATMLPPVQFNKATSDAGMNKWLVALEPNGKVLQVSVTKKFDVIDTSTPVAPGVTCVANAASWRSGAIAPGEIVSLFGPSIGPPQAASLQLNGGVVSNTLAGVQVEFAGIPAPLLYVSENQINAIVPFGVAGLAQATVQVLNPGGAMPPITVPVADSAPGIFTLDSSGSGQAAVLNQDGTINSSSHPAARGSTVSLFLTGAGLMQPAVADGSLGDGTTKPVLPISGILDFQPLATTYVGDAPTLVQGVVQVNCVVPSSVGETGTARRLVIGFGSAMPDLYVQAGVYVSVQ